jgi:hypothetical protein
MLAAGAAIPTNATPTVLKNSDWEPVKKRPLRSADGNDDYPSKEAKKPAP